MWLIVARSRYLLESCLRKKKRKKKGGVNYALCTPIAFLRMLFQFFYNWIKYKILPPSILFKNRLFLERNSQTYRIFSSLGSTFRSSKWSLFSQINIKKKLKTNLRHLLLLVFFFFIFFLNFFFPLYQHSSLFNNVSFLFWVNVDFFDYYLSFLIWFFYFFLSFLANGLYSYFFFNNFSAKNALVSVSQKVRLGSDHEHANKRPTTSAITNSDLNWAIYLWFSHTGSDSRSFKINPTSALFQLPINKTQWSDYSQIFQNLYKIIHLNNLVSWDVNQVAQKLENLSSAAPYDRSFDRISLAQATGVTKFEIWIASTTLSNTFSVKNKNQRNWSPVKARISANPLLLNSNTTTDSFLIQNKNGLFFLNNLDYGVLSFFNYRVGNAFLLNDKLGETALHTKLEKWLYKYSLLNRRFFKNSNKITNFKKLFNTTFSNSDVFNRNLWNTHYFSDNATFGIFSAFHSLFFNQAYSPLNADALKTKPFDFVNKDSKISSFGLFENSYFWIAKRLYFFNSLPAHAFFSNLAYSQNRGNFDLADQLMAKTSRNVAPLASHYFFKLTTRLTNATFYQNTKYSNLFEFVFCNQTPSPLTEGNVSFTHGNRDAYLTNGTVDYFTLSDLQLASLMFNTEFSGGKSTFLQYLTSSNGLSGEYAVRGNKFHTSRAKKNEIASPAFRELNLVSRNTALIDLYLLFFKI